jgi:hypothetical protein
MLNLPILADARCLLPCTSSIWVHYRPGDLRSQYYSAYSVLFNEAEVQGLDWSYIIRYRLPTI